MQKGLLVLCFDDGHMETYATAYPMLKKCGFVGVVGLITSYVGGVWRDWTDQGFSDYQLAGIAHLRQMRTDGWEMVSHSSTHSPHDWLAGTLENVDHFEMILAESRDWIVRNRLGDGRTFVYPFGAVPGGAVELVKKFYWLARGIESNPPAYYDLPLTGDQRYRLWSYLVQHPLSNESVSEIRSRIRYARRRPAIVTLTFHRITDQPRIYDVTPEELQNVLNMITDEGMETTTFEDVIDSVWRKEVDRLR